VQVRTLGALDSSALGFGTLALTGGYGPVGGQQAVAAIRRGLDLGITLLDTADFYGGGEVERLVGQAVAGRRGEVVIATRGGAVLSGAGRPTEFDGSPDFLRRACDESLLRLGVSHIDLYTLARLDPRVPVEESIGGLTELVRAGKVRHLGLSEVPAEVIRRAHAVHPIAAVQSEYSLWRRGVEEQVLPTVRELGIGFVAHTPLGRGFLSGALHPERPLAAGDYRSREERFSAPALAAEQDRLALLGRLATQLGLSLSQVSLAWLLAQGPEVVPIPGSRSSSHLAENVAAAQAVLTPEQVGALADAFADVPAGRA